ncbi:hypothetical protein PG995_002847 [Apiospora arundinis]
MEIPEIGRSGKELRVGYKLYAMEQQEPNNGSKWVMRQTATYHTMDLVKWKAFWVTVKANDLIQERVDEANAVRCGPSQLSACAEALSRSLIMHQIMFDWCTDGWGWHINEIADEVEGILRPITAAPIPSETDSLDPVLVLVKSLSLPTEEGGVQIDEKTSPLPSPANLVTLHVQNKTTPNGSTSGIVPAGIPIQHREAQIQNTTARLNVLKNFSFKGVRQLDICGNKLRDARTAITANMSMTGEISEIYKDTLNFTISSSDKKIRTACMRFASFKII